MLEGLTSNMPDAEGGVFMDVKYTKIQTAGCNAPLKITPGHFATNHAHINYYLDMTTLKTRLSAVSYTHLDVYKRQAEAGRRGCAG